MNSAKAKETDLVLSLAYQPVLDIRKGPPTVCAYESLMRASVGGRQRPIASLIQEAEEDGTIADIDLRVVLQVCETLVANPELAVWINLSQRTIESEAHARDIGVIISDAAVADRITIEITETHQGSSHCILNTLKFFRDNCIAVVVDDVEDDYALARLLDTDLVTGCKLSRASTIAIASDSARYDASRKLVEKCKASGKSTVLEGIETLAELNLATSLGVDYTQGWLFWPALPFHSIPKQGTQVILPPQGAFASLL